MKEILTMIVIVNDSHRQRVERLERDFDRDLDRNKRDLQWTQIRRSETFSTPTEYLENKNYADTI